MPPSTLTAAAPYSLVRGGGGECAISGRWLPLPAAVGAPLADLECYHLLALAAEAVGDQSVRTGSGTRRRLPGPLDRPSAIGPCHRGILVLLMAAVDACADGADDPPVWGVDPEGYLLGIVGLVVVILLRIAVEAADLKAEARAALAEGGCDRVGRRHQHAPVAAIDAEGDH